VLPKPTLLVVLPLVFPASIAFAKEEPPTAPASPPPVEVGPQPGSERAAPQDDTIPRRVFGLGTALGGGAGAVSVSATGSTATSGVLPLIMLPTVEAQIFIPDTDGFSVDVSLPLTNIIIASVALQGVFFQLDGFFNFNPGGQNVRLVAGPGIGFGAFSYSDVSFGSIRLLGEIGFEALTNEQGFSFKLLARPYFEAYLGELTEGTTSVGGGGLGLLSFSGNYVE
jgi:hypothetical protein